MEYNRFGDEAKIDPICGKPSMNEMLESTGRNLTDLQAILASILEILSGAHSDAEDKKNWNSMLDLTSSIQIQSAVCSNMANEIRTRLFG